MAGRQQEFTGGLHMVASCWLVTSRFLTLVFKITYLPLVSRGLAALWLLNGRRLAVSLQMAGR